MRPQEQLRSTPPRTAKGRQTREQIVDAAVAHFALSEYRRSSLTEVAEAARISPATIHRYFDRETLFAAAVARQTEQFVDALGGLLAGGETIAGALGGVGAALPALAADYPLVARVVAGREIWPPTTVLDQPSFDDLRARLVDRARYDQQNGSLRADLDAETVAAGIVTIVVSHLVRRLAAGHRGSDPDDGWSEVASLVATGLQPPSVTVA